jgi:glycosyltransferase 2 family protein
MKTWLRLTVTLVLCAVLLVYVVDLRVVVRTLAGFDPIWAAIAWLALSLDRVLMSSKWGLLLRIRGYRTTVVQRMTVYCSAMMWGLALPSTVGADGIRVLLARRIGVRVDDAIATILVERGIGFVSALVTALAGLVILRVLLPDIATYDSALLIGVVTLVCAIGILLFSFSARALRSTLGLLPQRLARSRAAEFLTRLHDAYRSLAGDRKRLALFSGLTLLEQLMMVSCYGLVAAALHIHFSAFYLFAAVPLAILVSRLPISIDGLGVYEGIFIAIMSLGGVRPEDSLAISLAARALQIIVWMPWWLMQAGRAGTVAPPADVTR